MFFPLLLAKGGKLGLRNTSKRSSNIAKEQVQSEKDKRKAQVKIDKMLDTLHEEPIKKLTIRVPISLHRIARTKVALDDSSLNEYIINLLKDDLVNETRFPDILT